MASLDSLLKSLINDVTRIQSQLDRLRSGLS